MTFRTELLEHFGRSFLGLDRIDPTFQLDGRIDGRRRVYLDTAATSLMPEVAWLGLRDYFESACADGRAEPHRAGRDTTAALDESRDAIGRLVGYRSSTEAVRFTSNGATGAIELLARTLFPPELRPAIKGSREGDPQEWLERRRAALALKSRNALDRMVRQPIVVSTAMEHQSNVAPWVEAVGRRNVRIVRARRGDGTLDLDDLARHLDEETGRIRLVAVAGVSNVTGILNPVHEIAEMAHSGGAEILVDGALWAPHQSVSMHAGGPERAIDYIALSGHKLYTPGSRGALIGSRSTLFDAGRVEYVGSDDPSTGNLQEAETPNVPGPIAMGIVAEALHRIGMDALARAERELTAMLIDRLEAIDGVSVYGSTDLDRVERAGVVSFNVDGAPHGLVAAYLDDFHNIAVRNGCFSAEPYVRTLLGLRDENPGGEHGMVRASLGPYSTPSDVDELAAAIERFVRERKKVEALYEQREGGAFRVKFGPRLPTTFRVSDTVVRWVEESKRRPTPGG